MKRAEQERARAVKSYQTHEGKRGTSGTEKWRVDLENAGDFSASFDRTMPISINDTVVLVCGPSTKTTMMVYVF